MTTPEMRFQNHLNNQNSIINMENKLSIFDHPNGLFHDGIYVHRIKEELKEIVTRLGGPIKASKLLNVKYSHLKESLNGRAPISLKNLETLLGFINENFRKIIKQKIDLKDVYLSCRYSNKKIKFPKQINEDIAYVVGLILGDGTLAGTTSNARGNWNIAVFFDNMSHKKKYDFLIKQIFDTAPLTFFPNKNCYWSYFSSKVLHWFFRNYFDICNGFKCYKISMPAIIKNSSNQSIKIAFLQGLFDSDGSVTKRKIVKYSSTSKIMADKVKEFIDYLKIQNSFVTWLKNEKVRPLYSVEIRSKKDVLKFSQVIGFRHPHKNARLDAIVKGSPIV